MSATCRSCGKPIFWIPSETTGKLTPIDVDPDPSGNVVIILPEMMYRVLKKREPRPPTTYTSHFATCPDAAKYRAKGA